MDAVFSGRGPQKVRGLMVDGVLTSEQLSNCREHATA